PADLLNTPPAEVGIGDCARAAHESDSPVAEFVKVNQRRFHGLVVVEDDIRDILNRAVRGDRYDGNRYSYLVGRSVQKQKTIDRTLHQHARILLDMFVLPVVARSEVEVVRSCKLLDNAAHHAGEISFAQIRCEHTY